MILIGDEIVGGEKFYAIKDFSDVVNTKPNSTVIFTFDKTKAALCKELQKNEVSFALFVKNKKDIIYANALGASYIVCPKAFIKIAQDWAESYLFDAKILLFSDSEDDIIFAAKNAIDGILFEKGVIDGSD
jgi:hypothetical protein